MSETMMNRISFRPSSMATCKGNNSESKLHIQELDDKACKQHMGAIVETQEATQKRARHLRGSAMELGLDEVPCRHHHKVAAHHSALNVTRLNHARASTAPALHEAILCHRTSSGIHARRRRAHQHVQAKRSAPGAA